MMVSANSPPSRLFLGLLMTLRLLLIAITFLLSVPHPLSAEDAVDFSREILPLLSENCFQCHGPDEANREAELRLDRQDAALAKLDSGAPAIVPGDSQQSVLFERIISDDSDLLMPPPESGKELSADEIARIQSWIDSGAAWGKHWSFQVPVQPALPPPVAGWKVSNPIDLFVQQRLQQAGLSPEASADKQTLIRRLTLDLTGMPPTIQEIDDFLADPSPMAVERVIDRLLDSSAYGEHMARIWLDAARYADTHGLHLDNERSIWPYRNWVIDAFNRNMPFDQFTIEQLAGDLLPEPTLDQRVATGFNRCNVTTSEGGSIDDEYYVRYAVDRVETTATVWLGLTAGCAACHDHKFDPLTQQEFYQLFSYFFSLTERAMDGNALLPPPIVKVPSEEQQRTKSEYQRQLTAVDQQVQSLLASANYVDPLPAEKLGELQQADFVWFDDTLPDGAKPEGRSWEFVKAPDHPVFSGDNSSVRTGTGLTQHFFSGANPPLTVGAPAKLFAYVYLDPNQPPEAIQLQFNDGSWNHRAYWGADKCHGAGQTGAANHHMGDLPETGKWVRLEVDAAQVGLKPESKLNGWAFTQFGGTVHWDQAGVVSIGTLPDQQLVSINLWQQYRQQVKSPPIPPELQKILDIEPEKRNEGQIKQLTHYYLHHVHPEFSKQFAEPIKRQS